MKLILKQLLSCPYCGCYVHANDTSYWCDMCNRYYDKITHEEVKDE